PLAVGVEIAFPKLEWADWTGENERGRPVPLRRILLTQPGDGWNRIFVPLQGGKIMAFPIDAGPRRPRAFLVLSKRVRYYDRENEEGLLGMAFHPKFKQNGEFFVFYTDAKTRLNNVVSRFRVSKSDPDRADPDSEEELVRFVKPFWNHDGGTIVFGPDG